MNVIYRMRLLFILFLILSASSTAQNIKWIDFNQNGKKDIYEDPTALLDERVNDLLSQMTIEEKISLLNDNAPEIKRLGVAKYNHGNEALHGIVRPGKFTVFPQAIGLAATWNPDLIRKVADVASTEARAKWNELMQGRNQKEKYSDLLTFWSPTVNMARDPRWGRTPETYGEDPYLSSQIGIAFVKGLQGNNPKYLKVVSTPKHFAVNNEEHNRFSCQVHVSEQDLRNYYLPAFQALITEGKAQSIMSAYPAINGIPCSANKWLLYDILRKEWGFNGYVVSDCGAVSNLFHAHHFSSTMEDAAAAAMKAGLDLECNGFCDQCATYVDFLKIALDLGKVTEQDIENAAFRVLRARFKLGMFDDPSLVPYSSISPSVIGCKTHSDLSLETARQSIVLLKNTGVLPLDKKKVKSIAVLGINAASCEFGDYSGIPVNDPVSPLEGIKKEVDARTQVYTLPWRGNLSGFDLIPSDCFFYEKDGDLKSGLKTEYFVGDTQNKFSETVIKQLYFEPANQAPDKNIPIPPMLVRWSGVIVPKTSGDYVLGVSKKGNARIYIDDVLMYENNQGMLVNDTVRMKFQAGQSYKFKMEYKDEGGSFCSLRWKTPITDSKDLYVEEKKLAKKCDVVILVMGINKSIEMEGRDRQTIELPEDQKSFIKEIYKVNPKTILVLVAGSQLAINWEKRNLPGIINAWYPGENGGTAIAEVLFGKYNPAGRLPLTYYDSLDKIPAFNNYDLNKGRTYMYYTHEPLFPFGYGLSYTEFAYSDISIDQTNIKVGDSIKVKVKVRNTGMYDGEEVVQLYLRNVDSGNNRPIKQLKGFKRISLKQNEMKEVEFMIDRNAMSFWNTDNEFVIESGTYEVLIGASSSDIRQRVCFYVD